MVFVFLAGVERRGGEEEESPLFWGVQLHFSNCPINFYIAPFILRCLFGYLGDFSKCQPTKVWAKFGDLRHVFLVTKRNSWKIQLEKRKKGGKVNILQQTHFHCPRFELFLHFIKRREKKNAVHTRKCHDLRRLFGLGGGPRGLWTLSRVTLAS